MIEFAREDDGKKGRFIVHQDSVEAGEMTFNWKGDSKIEIDHTEVKNKFRGKGHAKKLLAQAVEFAREKNVKIIPVCPFVKKELESDKSFQDVLA